MGREINRLAEAYFSVVRPDALPLEGALLSALNIIQAEARPAGPEGTALAARSHRDGEPSPLPPIIPLPRDWLTIKPLDDGRHVLIGAWGRLCDGELSTYWIELSWLDFPNPLAGLADLERLGVYDLYLAAVEELVHRPFEKLAEASVDGSPAE